MKYYINCFLVYSVLGFILETTLKIFFVSNMNNGIMFGPWIPVYGLGCVLIILIMEFVFKKIKVNRVIKIFLVFFLSFFLLTILEYLGGILIEKLFGRVFWNYKHWKFHFGHYISLEMSLIWGIMSLFIIYVVKPLLDKVIKKVPSFITYLALLIFICDLFYTFISLS